MKKKIIILGGGVTAWSIAALLRQQLPANLVAVCVVEDNRRDHYGAEAAHPSIHQFHQLINLDEKSCVQQRHTSFGLGVRYKDWNGDGQCHILTAGPYGASLRGTPFWQLYSKACATGVTYKIDAYSLNAMAAQDGRFGHPPPDPQSIYSQLHYGLHLQWRDYSQLLKRHALAAGVEVIAANCSAVNVNQAGAIQALLLDDHSLVEGDLFFDCTGSARVLHNALDSRQIVEAPLAGLFDRCAWGFAPAQGAGDPVAEIKPTAQGYIKTISLNGQHYHQYYFNSQHTVDLEIVEQLRHYGIVDIVFSDVGFYRSQQAWITNCIAVGGAAFAFPETYCSPMQLVRNAAVRFLNVFIGFERLDASAAEYNRLCAIEYDVASVFTELDFFLGRASLPSVNARFAAVSLSAEALHRYQLFSATGRHPQVESTLLSDTEWAALFLGNAVLPQSYDMTLDLMGEQQVVEFLEKLNGAFKRAIVPMPMHKSYVEKIAKH